MPIIERRTKAGVGGTIAATVAAVFLAPHLARAQELIPTEHQVRLSPDEAGLRLREPTGITAEKQRAELGGLLGPKSLGLNGLFVLKTGEGEYHPAVWLGKSMYLVSGAGEKMKLQEIKAGTVSAGVSGQLPKGFRYGAQVTGQYGSQPGIEARAGAGYYGKILDINALLSTQALQGSVAWHLGPKSDLSTIFSNRNAALQFSQTIDMLKTRLEAGVARDWEKKYPRGTAQLRATFDNWLYVHGGVDFMGGTGTHGAGTYVGAGVNVPLDVSKWKWGGAKKEPVTVAPSIVEKPRPVTQAQVEALKHLAMLGYEPRGAQGNLRLREPFLPGQQPWKLSKEEILKNQINLTMAQMVGAKGAGKRQLQQKLNSLAKELNAMQGQKAKEAKQAALAEKKRLAAEKQQAATDAAADKRRAVQEKLDAQKAAAAEKKRAAEEKRLFEIQKKKDEAQRRKLEKEQKKKGKGAPELPLEPIKKGAPGAGLMDAESKGIIAGVTAGKTAAPAGETEEQKRKRLKEEAADAIIKQAEEKEKREAEAARRAREEAKLAVQYGEGQQVGGTKVAGVRGTLEKKGEAEPQMPPSKLTARPGWMPEHVKHITGGEVIEKLLEKLGVKTYEERSGDGQLYTVKFVDEKRSIRSIPFTMQGGERKGQVNFKRDMAKRYYQNHLQERLNRNEQLLEEEFK